MTQDNKARAASHINLRGDRWLVRWRDEFGNQCKRSFAKKNGRDPETCPEAFDAQRTADQARGDWIDPRIGRTPFSEYAPVCVKSRLHNLQTVKGLAPSTIETIYVILASIMRGAVRDGYIRKTPCDDIRLPEIIPTVIRLVTPAQVLALAAVMPRQYALLVLLGAGAGLRQGEAFGLAVDGIDIAAGMITVRQQVIVVDRRPILAAPNSSASVRDVPLPAFPRDAITSHISDLALADQHCPCRGRPDLRGVALARAQLHHHHGGPVRSPGPGGQPPCP